MTEPRFFGTDGIRGQFGRPPLDQQTVRRLGAALGVELTREAKRPLAVLGGDTRDSTPTLCGWLAAELWAQGVDICYLGTVPTPAIAATVVARGAACGIAVSASHNPYPDNGIKLIDAEGFKWSPADEVRLEERMETVETSGGSALPAVDREAVEAYLAGLVGSLDGRRLEGLKVVLDTGYGAASPFAERLFTELGASVVVLHDEPDGTNINRNAGSTHPEILAEAVVREGADMGVAFDGDADRAVLVDELGEVRDGDAILYLWAMDLALHDALPGRGVVATSMSNLGLEVALDEKGIDLVRCGVGDREVVATLQEEELVLGGEQSGHIVHLELSTTGDGLLTAVQLADARHRRGRRTLSLLLEGFKRFPQLLRNLPVARKPVLDRIPEVQGAVREVEKELGDKGRLVLRYSGTEPLVRIMIEGPDTELIERLADRLETVLVRELA